MAGAKRQKTIHNASELPTLEYFDAKHKTDALEFDKPIEPHAPDLYKASESCGPFEYNSVPRGSFAAVEKAHISAYGRQGYLVVENALDSCRVDAILTALREVISSLEFQERARATTAAQSSGDLDLANGGPHPVLQFEAFAKHVAEEERYKLEMVRKLAGFHEAHPVLNGLSSDSELLRVVRHLLVEAGCSETEAAEVEVFQSLSLLKPPGGREKPWHQDNSYFNVDHENVRMVGVWIALTEVTQEMGAMHVLPAPLGELRPITHFTRRDWQICDTDVLSGHRRIISVPLKPGGALFFSTMLPHGTPTNTSPKPRYAVQFHFIPKCFRHRISVSERKSTWGEEGAPGVSC